MKRALEGITLAGFLVAFWAAVFSWYIGSPILQTVFEWLLLFNALILIMLIDKAWAYYEMKIKRMMNEEER